jgi:glycosyltransferase involved in cell wall biosynthesis
MDRTQLPLDVLVVEPGVPRPTVDAGSRAIVDFVHGARELGLSAELGVESAPAQLETFVSRVPRAVVLSRPGTFLRNYHRFDSTQTRILYFAHDLHFERMRAGRRYRSPHSELAAGAMEVAEKECFRRANLTLVPTIDEEEAIRRLVPGANVQAFNYYWFAPSIPASDSCQTNRVVFVGSVDHAPNVDAVYWCLEEIWPRVLSSCDDAELALVGQWESILSAEEKRGVTVLGHLSDHALDKVLRESAVGIAPLRFGAGMKRKTVHYLSHGLPTVTTAFGIQGLSELASNTHGAFVADSADRIARHVVTLLTNEVRRKEMSTSATRFIASRFSKHAYLEGLKQALCP